jgi:DNA-binding MarR family transcriptional regulator
MSGSDYTQASVVCLALMRLGTRMAAQFDNWFADAGITQAQFRMLLAIWQRAGREGSITPSALAEHLFIERPTATVLIARLVERGLVVRVPSQEDRRSYGLRLTEAGGLLLQTIGPVATEKAEKTLADFTADEQALLRSMLGRLESYLRENPPE